MKLWERVIERRLRRMTKVSEFQFGFMSGRYTMEAIHIIRSLMEKYRERQKDLHLAFLDLENAYDSMWVYTKAQLLARTCFALILDELTKGIALEDKGLRVSREKTEYMRYNFNRNDNNQNEEIRIGDHILEPKESFRYLGSVMHKSGRIEDDVTHRIQVGWLKWMKWRAPSHRNPV
ncbi:retrovirus-related pol polyprotein LINE-1 [Tanacetum coccineum]